MASPFFESDTPVQLLECKSAWDALDLPEKFYAYYFSKAALEGSKICFFQRSYESPGLFLLFQEVFGVPDLKEKALAKGVTEEQYNQFVSFAAGVYTNTGNYRGFGDTKIIPELPIEKFNDIISIPQSPRIDRIWSKISEITYSPTPKQLGFADQGGATSYYSPGMTLPEAEMVKRFLASQNLTDVHVNSRLWKVDGVYEVRIASMQGHPLPICKDYEFEGNQVKIVNGDYWPFMNRLVLNLSEALPYVANPTQERMLVRYIKHFTNGDINEHKESQKEWVTDKGPVVETDIGFIENYADPLNIRAEFEGFVSIVDKAVSAKFAELVRRAEEIIPLLPWGKVFEKDKFQAPDFTSLDVVTFATSGVPIGINIPNYDDIRMNFGFKNVNLGNAYPKVTPTNLQYLEQPDIDLIVSMYGPAETVAVALHELLGHGSGKLLIKNEDGTFNFDPEAKIPWSGETISSWYNYDETWSSKFGSYSSAYEECRAETVALYLSCHSVCFEIFGVQETEKARNMVWMYMAYSGIKSLLMYNPEAQKWGQAHSWARYVIFSVLLEANTVSYEFVEDSFILRMNYESISTTGYQAISDFLTKLHVYKSTGDAENGKKFFDHYSVITPDVVRIRDIIVANQKPRRCNAQCTLVNEGNDIRLLEYPETLEGVVKSFQDKYPEYDTEMLEFWEVNI